MKKTTLKWIIIAISLVVIIGGASILYNSLSDDLVDNDGFIVDLPSDTADDMDVPTSDATTDSEEASSTEVSEPDSSDTPETEAKPLPEPTNPATNFTVIDADGNEVSLTDMRGKPVVVNFWASWCPPCKAEMPDFEEMYKKYGDKVVFMMVNMTDGFQETISKAKTHVSNNGYTFPVYFDTKSSAATAYNVSSIPCTYLIDEIGNLVAHKIGLVTASQLEEGISLILN